MEAHKRKMYTYADYEKLPQRPAYQLIDGDLVMTPAPTLYHQAIVFRLLMTMGNFVENQKLGTVFCSPIDVCLSDTETYQPDIVYVHRDRMHILGEKNIGGSPDVIVEILSPGTGYYDLTHKKNIYQSAGVKEYWIVDPLERTIEILQNRGGEFCMVERGQERGRVGSILLDGLFIDLEDIFRPIAM